jgi:hypothetical protein
MRDETTNETLTLHRAPLQTASGVPQGLALDLNTPPPTQPTLGIATVLPTIGSPIYSGPGISPPPGVDPSLG